MARESDSRGQRTAAPEYTDRLVREEGARWKRVLDVQRPYRWNLARLQPGHTLEVGCGIGRNLAALPDAVGVDHNAESIAVARERGLDAWTGLEWPDCPDAVEGAYDSLLLAHVLEHLDQDAADALVEPYLPYLKADAKLILICPQERGFASDPTHIRWVDHDEMERTARIFGFETTKRYSFPFPRIVGRVFPYNEFVLVAERRSL